MARGQGYRADTLMTDFNGENHEDRHSSHLQQHHSSLQARHLFRHRADSGGRPAGRAVQRVPSVLHRQAEAGRYRWPRRAFQQALRRAQEQVILEISMATRSLRPGRSVSGHAELKIDPAATDDLTGIDSEGAFAWPYLMTTSPTCCGEP